MSSPLSAGDLARMQADAAELMPDACEIQRPTYEPDGQGGQTFVGFTTLTTVACRLALPTFQSAERLAAERVGVTLDWVVTLPAGTDVVETDRIVSGARTLEVVGTNLGESYLSGLRAGTREVR